MRMNFRLLFIFVSLISSYAGISQDDPPRHKYVEKGNGLIAFQTAVPSQVMQSAIKNNMGNLGFGIGISGLTNPFSWGRKKHNNPIRIGAEAGYTYYGRFLSDVYINSYRGSYKTSYGIVQLNALVHLRLRRPEYVTPFVEGLVGGNFYLSTTKENLTAIETGLGIQAFDFGSYSSASFNKGVAMGFTIGKVRENTGRFTIRFSYNWATAIKYVVRNSLIYNPVSGNLEYQVGKAPVRYLMVQVGIGI